jgi:hypothetical protein
VRRRMNADNRNLELTRRVAPSAGSLIAATKALRGDENSTLPRRSSGYRVLSRGPEIVWKNLTLVSCCMKLDFGGGR